MPARESHHPGLRISDYDQITNDGRLKTLAGTDGSRLYFNLDPSHPPAEIAIAGGEVVPLKITFNGAVARECSPDGSTFLVGSESVGQTSGYPLWSVGILGGAPRSLATSVTASTWSPDGASVAYATPNGDIYEEKNNGAEAAGSPLSGDAPNGSPGPDGAKPAFFDQRQTPRSSPRTVSNTRTSARQMASHPPAARAEAGARLRMEISSISSPHRPTQGLYDERRAACFGKPPAEPVQLTSGPLAWATPIPGKNGKTLFATGLTRRGQLDPLRRAVESSSPALRRHLSRSPRLLKRRSPRMWSCVS